MIDDRLFDLVRYSRHALYLDGLLDDKEFAELTLRPSSKKSVARLESYDEIRARMSVLQTQNDDLRAALLNKRGDDLCWVEDPEKARMLPESEFLESCRRFRAQIADDRGESRARRTIAQLESRIVELEVAKEEGAGHVRLLVVGQSRSERGLGEYCWMCACRKSGWTNVPNSVAPTCADPTCPCHVERWAR